jgi:hypothetical protein
VRNRLLLVAGLLAALPGCGRVLCDREALRASLRTPLVAGEDATSDVLVGNLEGERDAVADLDALELAIQGGGIGGRGISIWLQRGLDHTLNLTLRLPTPLRAGDVLTVTAVHSGERPFWGTLANPPAGLSVGVTLDAFQATAVGGTARVAGLEPLRVDLDLLASGAGRQFALGGRLTVAHETFSESCFE